MHSNHDDGNIADNPVILHGPGKSDTSFPVPAISHQPAENLLDEAIDWLVLLRSGSISDQDRQQFQAWYRQDALHSQAYVEAQALWGTVAEAAKQDAVVAMASQQRLKSLSSRPPRRFTAAFAAAASLAICMVTGWQPLSNWARSDFSTVTGEQKQVTLSDGSRVLMNTDTAIALEWSSEKRRTVLLHGQAEFQVAKDSARPFEVVAGSTSVTALGTVFEVYRQEAAEVEIKVSEHAVSVKRDSDASNHEVRVEEGQQLRVSANEPIPRPVKVDMQQIQAWKRGKVIFQDQPLAKVVAELNRYCRAKILINDEAIEQLRVSGVFPIDDIQVLEAIQSSLNIRSTRLGPWLVILHG